MNSTAKILFILTLLSFLFLLGCVQDKNTYLIKNTSLENIIDSNLSGASGEVPFVNQDGNSLKVSPNLTYDESQSLLELLNGNGEPFCNGSLNTECFNFLNDEASCGEWNSCTWVPNSYCANSYSDPACYGIETLDCSTLDQATCENYPAYYDCYWDGATCNSQGYGCINMSGDVDACLYFGCSTEYCSDFITQPNCEFEQQSGSCYWQNDSYCDGFLTCSQPTQSACDNIFGLTGECVWDLNVYVSKVKAGQVEMDANFGTPPAVVDSNTKVDNLNCDLLDGLNYTAFQTAGSYVTYTNSLGGRFAIFNSVSNIRSYTDMRYSTSGGYFLVTGLNGLGTDGKFGTSTAGNTQVGSYHDKPVDFLQNNSVVASIKTNDDFAFVGEIVPNANNGSAIGNTSYQWSDIFLAEGGVINWDNGDATLTQTGNKVVLAGAGLGVTDLNTNNLFVNGLKGIDLNARILKDTNHITSTNTYCDLNFVEGVLIAGNC